MHNNKERQGLDKYESEGKNKRYISLPFIAPSSLAQRK